MPVGVGTYLCLHRCLRMKLGVIVVVVGLFVGYSGGQKLENVHLRVGTVLEKPWAYYNEDGVLEGYAIDITQRQGFYHHQFTHGRAKQSRVIAHFFPKSCQAPKQ